MNNKHYFVSIICAASLLSGVTQEEKQTANEAMRAMMQKIYSESMKAKVAFQDISRDEHFLSNLASTAPTTPFIINADIGEDVEAGEPEAVVYVSTNDQDSWYDAVANPLGTPGYETTWEASVNTDGGNTAAWYVEGKVDASALGYDYGRIYVTQTPKYDGFLWDPPDNYFQRLVDEDSGDAPSGQDIYDIQGTYKDDRIYFKMSIDGGCCDEGSFFGPWYLYGVGFFNPESESPVAYAIGYGDGGFGQLTPGLLKLSGDLESGEISGFDYITTNINYEIDGNDLYVSCLMSYFLEDPDFGPWPNTFGNGLAVLGVTVEAGLDGIDVTAEVLDQTNPGMDLLVTQFQDDNFPIVLTSPDYDDAAKTVSVQYSDADGNLPWFKSAQICYSPEDGGVCFHTMDLIPDSHTYADGVQFSASFTSEDVADGDYEAHFWFIDSTVDDYPDPQIILPISVGGGGGECDPAGDVNDDGVVNVLDVVVTVNIILCPDCPGSDDPCADVNGDGAVNVLDVVLIVNIILTGS